ncbi:MAG: SHOCT domain-containing protein [Christensenellaceae bacterium]|jgi:hypothetical protein|nr:SHOCT domain-containing protein [Christensenellaceae bacterium]
MRGLLLESGYYEINDEQLAEFLMVYIGFSLLICTAFLVLQSIASVRVSKMGGSGAGFFFLGWIYICCSNKADEWVGFSKGAAIVLGLLTGGVGLSIYVLVTLKLKNANIKAKPSQNFFAPNSLDNPSGESNSKIEELKKLKADGTITEEEYKRLVIKELEK